MLFADRFGVDVLDENIMKQFFTWSYSIRIKMSSVFLRTADKYALGNHEQINENLNIFNRINEMMNPEEVNEIILDEINGDTINLKYKPVYDKLKEWNGW